MKGLDGDEQYVINFFKFFKWVKNKVNLEKFNKSSLENAFHIIHTSIIIGDIRENGEKSKYISEIYKDKFEPWIWKSGFTKLYGYETKEVKVFLEKVHEIVKVKSDEKIKEFMQSNLRSVQVKCPSSIIPIIFL